MNRIFKFVVNMCGVKCVKLCGGKGPKIVPGSARGKDKRRNKTGRWRKVYNDTVIVIASDHYPYGLKSNSLTELYGYPVKDDPFLRDHSRLIIWSGILEDMDPIVVDTPTSSLDILPTLSNLFGTEFDSRLMAGRDVFSDAPALVYTMNYDWKTEYGTYLSATHTFTPASEDLLIPEGYVEQIKAIVRNRIRFSSSVLNEDYWDYLFGED